MCALFVMETSLQELIDRTGARVRLLEQQQKGVRPSRPPLRQQKERPRAKLLAINEKLLLSSPANIAKGENMVASAELPQPLPEVAGILIEELHIPRLRHNVSADLDNNRLSLVLHQEMSISEVTAPPGASTASLRVEPRNQRTVQQWVDATTAAKSESSYFVNVHYDVACTLATPLTAAEKAALDSSSEVVLQIATPAGDSVRDIMLRAAGSTSACVRLSMRQGETVSRVCSTIENDATVLAAAMSIEFGEVIVNMQTNVLLGNQTCVARNHMQSACGRIQGVLQPLHIATQPVTAISAEQLIALVLTSHTSLVLGARLGPPTGASMVVKHLEENGPGQTLVIAVPLYLSSTEERSQSGDSLTIYNGTSPAVVVLSVVYDLVGVGCDARLSTGTSLNLQSGSTCLCRVAHAVTDTWPYSLYFDVTGVPLRPAQSHARPKPSVVYTNDGTGFTWNAHHAPWAANLHTSLGYDPVNPLATVHRKCSHTIQLAAGAYTAQLAALQLRHHLRSLVSVLDTSMSTDLVDVTVSAVDDVLCTKLVTSSTSCTTALGIGNAVLGTPLTLLGLAASGITIVAGTAYVHPAPSRAPRAVFDRNQIEASVDINNGAVVVPLDRCKQHPLSIVIPEGTGLRHVYRAAAPSSSQPMFPLQVNDVQTGDLITIRSIRVTLSYISAAGETKALGYEHGEVPFTAVVQVTRVVPSGSLSAPP